eukprot:TRINITY_DN48115_c0_g1_i1.p2 TRINITY_DN48115_c0_g1~~TRINITY_DN48115_c0_g1_i1.p2  ORF type:complete len:137 (-),score=35.55 TRINITY_DN48115_c0_g1_i1:57-467(-)
MIRRPPRSTLSSSSAASDVYKRQECCTDACRKQAACTSTGCLSTDHPRICPYPEELISSQCTAGRACLKTPAGWFDAGPGWKMWFYVNFEDYDRDGVANHLDPVSYTHLRAHETPEHLVCRLLLEKNKNNRLRKSN